MFESNINEDGYDDTVTYSRDGIETIRDLLDFYAVAARAASFSYVDRVGYTTDKGAQTWGNF
jgi:hypothetical protein